MENSLVKFLEEFAGIANSWFSEKAFVEERFNFFNNFFKAENIAKAEWADFQKIGENLHAFQSLALAKKKALGNPNTTIEKYRTIFNYLKYGTDPIEERINNLSNSKSTYHLPYFGDSTISELIGNAFPDKYVFYNTRDGEALSFLKIKVEKKRGDNFGDKFIKYNDALLPVLKEYKSIVGQRTQTTIHLELDQFFSWLYSERIPKTDKFTEFIEKLIDNAEGDPKFTLQFNQSHFTNKYIWLGDSNGIIGNTIAHYEIYFAKKSINLDVHFESNSSKKLFKNKLGNLPKGYKWFGWGSGDSIRSEASYNLKDENAIEDVKNGLINLDRDLRHLLHNAIKEISPTKYWLYSPGENANKWGEFYNDGIMGLGFDHLGDLNDYSTKDEITKKLQSIEKTESSKKNDATANYDFKEKLSIGDIVIAKKGRKEYIGYGIVTSNYFYNHDKDSFQKSRKINWKKKGTWPDEKGDIVLKTLTDITKYPDYVIRLKKLIGIDSDVDIKDSNMNLPPNLILYGPPGTGKTHNTVLRAAEIIEEHQIRDYQEAKEVFNSHLGDRIEFITFHQNYSYEDFIQGLRPDTEQDAALTFEKKDGVFKRISTNALFEYYRIWKQQSTDASTLATNETYLDFIEYLKNSDGKTLKSSTGIDVLIDSINKNNNIEFKSINSSRTYLVSGSRLLKLFDAYPKINLIKNVVSDIRDAIGGCNETVYWAALNEFINFHNRHSKEIISSDEDIYEEIGYDSKVRLLSTVNINELNNIKDADVPKYVIIIDEINRANISRVFGELITLIEPDKRSHGEIPLMTTLPSGDQFIVPSNLYIIGTMNTADKSIALLDIALRRRFEFEAMYPKYSIDGHTVHDSEILKKINKKIIDTKGHDFQIGHSYFMGSDFDLKDRMNKKVIPLLLEYYMNDADEVKKILAHAELEIEENSWPIKIAGKRA